MATAAELTIGPGITVQGTEGGTITGHYSQDSIVNQGTIDADTSGQTITVSTAVQRLSPTKEPWKPSVVEFWASAGHGVALGRSQRRAAR